MWHVAARTQDMTKPAMAALISHKARSTAPEALEKSFREWLGDLRVLQEAGPSGLDGENWGCDTL